MTHEYNTRTKKEALVTKEALAKVEENIISTINYLKEEIITLKDNECSVNALEQYGRRNNIVVSGIPAHVSERDLEETVTSVLSDTEVNVSPNHVKTSHRIGKPDSNK